MTIKERAAYLIDHYNRKLTRLELRVDELMLDEPDETHPRLGELAQAREQRDWVGKIADEQANEGDS